MEKTYLKFSEFLTLASNTLISLIKILLRSKFRVHLPMSEKESCIVLGNGPSLKQSLQKHPDFFKNHPLICVNSFSVTKEYEELKPTYYIILDPGFWYSGNTDATVALESIKTKTSWPIHILVPQLARKATRITELAKQNSNITIHYFNYTVFKGFESIAHFLYKKNLAMPQSQNVLVASLFLSVNIGFKKIYLFGADHSWHQHLHVNKENVLCVKHIHFYEDLEEVEYVPFYKGAHLKETFKMHEIMTTLGKTFYGYDIMNNYAKSSNTCIYNASEISFIDTFNRLKL